MSVRLFIWAFCSCQCAAAGVNVAAPTGWLCDVPAVWACSVPVDTLNAAEVMVVRPEDKNARRVQQAFANLTLAELEQHLGFPGVS